MKLVVVLAALAIIGAAPERDPSPFFISQALVPKIDCGPVMGSGVRIAADTVITATHVTGKRECSIDGSPVTVIYNGPGLDFTTLRTNIDDYPFRAVISCEGIREGQIYYVSGYPWDGAFATEILVGTSSRSREKGFEGLAVFKGVIHSGQSGGAIADDRGRVVAIANASNDRLGESLGRSLADTYLCKGARA